MRRIATALALIALVAPRPVQAEESIDMFLKAMGVALLNPVVALVFEIPLHVAAWARGTDIAPRPTAGRVRMETTLPWRDDALILAHFDLGGYPGRDARVGWEARSDLYAYNTPPWSEGLQMRWDGLGLFNLSPETSVLSLEALLGGTVWPRLAGARDWQWAGGLAAGVRLGTWTPRRLLRIEAEALQLVMGGEQCEGIEQTFQFRFGTSVRMPWFGRKIPQTGFPAFGLSYLGLFPSEPWAFMPRINSLLFSATF